jgi:hypothetical protein
MSEFLQTTSSESDVDAQLTVYFATQRVLKNEKRVPGNSTGVLLHGDTISGCGERLKLCAELLESSIQNSTIL